MAGLRCCLAIVGLVLALSAQPVQLLAFNSHAANLEDAFEVDVRDAFADWMRTYNKNYASDTELEHRFQVWTANADKILRRSAEHAELGAFSAKLGLNALSDLTSDEFRSRFLSRDPVVVEQQELTATNDEPQSWRYDHVTPKEAVDWNAAGVVGPIRAQHYMNWSCGSCWAFATVGIAEIASAMHSGVMVPGSEQQLIDCDRGHGDHGCNGGAFKHGLDYIIRNKGLTSEGNYPYVGHDQQCDVDKEDDHALSIDSWEAIPKHNESALLQAITMRPVVTAVCCGANLDDWHHYTGGVFDVPCCVEVMELDHAIVLVGYGEEEGKPYWLLKNSWSDGWGENGYMKIARDVPRAIGQCGLASMPTMVFKGKPPKVPKGDGEEQQLVSLQDSVARAAHGAASGLRKMGDHLRLRLNARNAAGQV